jgi:hypothetical protein
LQPAPLSWWLHRCGLWHALNFNCAIAANVVYNVIRAHQHVFSHLISTSSVCVRLTVQAAKTNLEGLRDKLTAQLAAATEAEAVQAKERGKAEVPFVEHGDQLYLLRLA